MLDMERSDMNELTAPEVAELAEQLHHYAELENLRPAFRALCDFAAAILEAALDGEVSEEFAGDVVDLWAEAAERECDCDCEERVLHS